MKIHEYQGKALLAKYGVPVPYGKAVTSLAEAEAAIADVMKTTGGEVVVVKAQIHAGGRGKGGGVKVAKGAAAALDWAKKIYGMQLVTIQTGPEGKKVQRLLIEQGLDIARELYLGMTLDRATGRVLFDRELIGKTLIAGQADRPSAERQAVPLLAEDLARNITSLLVDGRW